MRNEFIRESIGLSMKGDINEPYLNSIVRLEVKNYELTQIPSTFYKDVRNYLEDLKNRIDTETAKKNLRMVTKLTLELGNSEKYFKSIVERRISKILHARSVEERELVEGRLTPEEQIFYEGLNDTVRRFSEELLHGGIVTGPEVAIATTAGEKEMATERKEIETKTEESGKEYAIVYMKQDVENISIMGEKINLRKEDIITLPVKYADIIDKQGLGKKLRLI